MKIEYEEINGLLYPKLALPPQKEVSLTRFGRKRLQYLKQYRPIVYTNLLINGELNEHLQMIDDEANVLYDRLIEQYKIKLLFCKWVVIIRLFTRFRAHCISISHSFWRQNCHFYKF